MPTKPTFRVRVSTFLTVALTLVASVFASPTPTLSAAPATQEPAGVAQAFLRYLDTPGEADGDTRQHFFVRQSSTSLEHLGAGIYVSKKHGTAGSTVVHLDPNGQPRLTQFTVNAQGALVVDSSLVEDGDLVRSLVVHDADGQLRVVPTGVDDEIAPCLEKATRSEDLIESLLDCLGLTGGDGSDPGFMDWLDDLRNPDCEDDPGIALDKDFSSSSVNVWVFVDRVREKYPNGKFERQLQDVLEAMDAWNEAFYVPDDGSALRSGERAVVDAVVQLMLDIKASGNVVPNSGTPILSPDTGPRGGGTHPGCQERKDDSAQGTLFMNSEFCSSGDHLKCLAEENDPVRRITDGKCRTVEGPAGGVMLSCGEDEEWSMLDAQQRAQEEATSNCGVSPDGTESYCDFNSPFMDAGDIGKEYIDTIDLGPVLQGLCVVGGCDDFPLTLRPL